MFQIDYIASGGSSPRNPAWAFSVRAETRFCSPQAQEYYFRKAMANVREYRASYAPWERINEYGVLYRWGRGGRTLAPDGLYGSRRPKTGIIDGMSAAALTDLILIVESFNAYVTDWCSVINLRNMWHDRI